MAERFTVTAGSEYGRYWARYEVVGDVFTFVSEGGDSSLVGNRVASEFGGLTVDEAYAKRDAINNELPEHAYDGCHACKFAVWVEAE